MMQRESKMEIRLWNSNLAVSDSQVEKLQDFILNYLASRKDGKESVSHLIQCVRENARFRMPTGHSDAMTFFEALGFKIEKLTKKDNPRIVRAWFVTL
jgi:hypothetical protein